MNPETWTIGEAQLRAASERLRVLAAAPLADAATPPAYYDDYCRRRFLALRFRYPQLEWRDVAPIFALAVASHQPERASAEALAPLYPELRSGSRLDWDQARAVIEAAWTALPELR